MTQEKWRGIGKLIEECGEVLQLLGKVVPFPDGPHPDGKGALRDRLPVELADLRASMIYFEVSNNLEILTDRTEEKLRQFRHWGLTGIMDLRAPVLTHDMGCALHVGKECDCGVASRTTGPAPERSKSPQVGDWMSFDPGPDIRRVNHLRFGVSESFVYAGRITGFKTWDDKTFPMVLIDGFAIPGATICGPRVHDSDCAIYNAPAYEAGPCSCGAVLDDRPAVSAHHPLCEDEGCPNAVTPHVCRVRVIGDLGVAEHPYEAMMRPIKTDHACMDSDGNVTLHFDEKLSTPRGIL